MNHFISITSNGGYIGRWVWCNTGSIGAALKWGSCGLFPITTSGAWAGSTPFVRYLTR